MRGPSPGTKQQHETWMKHKIWDQEEIIHKTKAFNVKSSLTVTSIQEPILHICVNELFANTHLAGRSLTSDK